MLTPLRSGGGHRRYSRRQLEFAARMRALFDEGMTLDAAARIVGLQDELDTARARISTLEANDAGVGAWRSVALTGRGQRFRPPALGKTCGRAAPARRWLLREAPHKHSVGYANSILTAIDDFYLRRGLGKAGVERDELPQTAPRALDETARIRWLRTVEAHLSPRDRAIALILYYAGARISEGRHATL